MEEVHASLLELDSVEEVEAALEGLSKEELVSAARAEKRAKKRFTQALSLPY